MRRRAAIVAFVSLVPLARAASQDLRPAPPEIQALPAGDHPHMWQTRRFVIAANGPLKRDTLERFSQVVDTVPVALARLPLPRLAPPAGAAPRIEILDERSYENAGAEPGTAGFYDNRPPPRLLVRRKTLLAPPHDQRTRLAATPDQDLLVHELTHLCMHRYLGRTPQWFAEGACEYLACLHQADGRFSFRNVDRAIREHLRSRYNPNDPTIALTPVAELAWLSGNDWLDFTGKLPRHQRYQPYATALLLFHYHFHGGDARREALREQLERSLRSRRPQLRWLDRQETPAIEQALVRYWEPQGLKLQFVTGS